MATDQFCLRWNNFQVNITSALESLKSDEDLVDVTLTCEGQNVKAHKVILSACSPYFRNVFKENPCQHPVVILKDVKYEDVTALLNFMYQGEVYITQDRLAPFLQTAEILQVRGLTGAANPFKDLQSPSPGLQPKPSQQHQQQSFKAKKNCPLTGQVRRVTPPLSISPSVPLMTPAKTLRAPKSPSVSSPFKELGSGAALSVSKEKTKESSQVILSRDMETEHSTRSSSPGVPPLQSHQSPANYGTAGDQPSTSFSPLYQEQSAFSAPVSPLTFQQHSNDSSSHLQPLSFANTSNVQGLSQSTSPPAAKSRKAFPRRVSSGLLSAEQSVDPSAASDDVKELPHDSLEPADSESLLKEVSVKMECGDVELDSDHDEEEYPLETFAEGDVEDIQKTGEFDDPTEDQGMAEEESGEMGAVPSSQSMLLRSLSGQQLGISQNDDRPLSRPCPFCFKVISNKSNLLKHVRIRHSGKCLQQHCQICGKLFKNKYSLKVHEYTYHRTIQSPSYANEVFPFKPANI